MCRIVPKNLKWPVTFLLRIKELGLKENQKKVALCQKPNGFRFTFASIKKFRSVLFPTHQEIRVNLYSKWQLEVTAKS